MTEGTSDTHIVKLRKPVCLKEGDPDLTYGELRLREPTGSEWAQWDRLDGIAADKLAVATVSGVPVIVVNKIGARDLREAAVFIGSFLAVDQALDAEDMLLEELTIALRSPLEENGKPVVEISLCEPTAEVWEEFDKLTGAAADLKAIAMLTGLKPTTVGRIGVRDLARAARFIRRFFADAPTAGAKS